MFPMLLAFFSGVAPVTLGILGFPSYLRVPASAVTPTIF